MKLRLPLFVVFEGIDGAGKSTLVDMLFLRCTALGIPAWRGMEPTRGEWGMKIRRMLGGEGASAEEQVRLFMLDREDDVRDNIAPALESGKLVILDRYYFSNAAYQGAQGLEPSRIIEMNRERRFPAPDRVYLVDIDPATAMRRVGNRGGEGREIFETERFLERVRSAYAAIMDNTFLVLDGRMAPDEIISHIERDMEDRFSIYEKQTR